MHTRWRGRSSSWALRWAALELGEGVNRFRKALGAVALVYIVMRLGATLDTT